MPSTSALNLRPPVQLPRARLAQVVGKPPGRVADLVAGIALAAVCALPASVRDALARFVGTLAFTLGIRRRVALENLAHAFPEKRLAERKAIARGAYVCMARTAVESLVPDDHLDMSWEDAAPQGEAWEALLASVARGQGALLVTGHLGNWERAGKMLLRRGIRLNALVRPLAGAINARIVDNRLRAGGGLIYPRGAITQVLKALRLGECVMVLLDQALPSPEALFVPFFGRLASTTPAMAVAARRSGAPVFLVLAVRDASGRKLHLEVEGPLAVPPGPYCQQALVMHTAQVTAALERHIRRHPEQWLWLHRRWKVPCPPGDTRTSSSFTGGQS